MNLQKSLLNASHLARCGNAIEKLQNNQVLDKSEEDWVLNLFNVHCRPAKEHSGKISFFLFEDDKNVAVKLFNLSSRIESNKIIQEDWELILSGLIRYRQFLLEQRIICVC